MATIKEDFEELRGRHGKAKEKSRIKIFNVIREALDSFKDETGCNIIDISMDLSKHYRGVSCDMTVITRISIKSDIEESF